jgi:hypothetical protein
MITSGIKLKIVENQGWNFPEINRVCDVKTLQNELVFSTSQFLDAERSR